MKIATKGFLRRSYEPSIGGLQQLLDLVVTMGILYGAVYWRDGEFHEKYYPLVVLSILLLLLIYRVGGVYQNLRLGSLVYQVGKTLRAWLLVLGVLLLVGWGTKSTALYSRQALSVWVVMAFVFQVLDYYVITLVLYLMRRMGYNLRGALIISSSSGAIEVAERLEANWWYGIRPLGYLEVKSSLGVKVSKGGLKCLGGIEQLEETLQRFPVNMVYLHLPLPQSGLLLKWMPVLLRANVSVHWVPKMGMLNLLTQSVRELGGLPVLCLSDSPLEGTQHVLKWLMDKVLAVLLLLSLSWLWLLVSLAVWATSKGPVLFTQKRVGLKGSSFWLYKFRTMELHKEKKGQSLKYAHKGDERFTSIGGWLRSFSLDELPQLLNVLKGDMSLVGPRPHAEAFDDQYQRQVSNYMLRHRIKPGLTGWAQVNGYRGDNDHPEKIATRIEYDLYYIKHWSLWFDFVILFKTLGVVISRKNAC